ncbi:MAG: M28 family peptidase [Pirellulales bacterium]|nr:M28 family peptidase [Pirellulales bacterium]
MVLRNWWRCSAVVSVAVLAGGFSAAWSVEADEQEAAVARLKQGVGLLASEAMQGRGPGSAGINQAADWVAEEFAALGLVAPQAASVAAADGATWAGWQPFEMTLEAKLGPAASNYAELVGPPGADGSERVVPLELGRDYTPLAAGGSGEFDLPLAFLGYGITAPQEDYDDYGSIDAKGDAVVLLRHEPQQDNPHSLFDGNQNSRHAALSRKIANASEHEVGGVIFLNDAVAVARERESIDRRVDAAIESIVKKREAYRGGEAADAQLRRGYLEEVAAEAAAVTRAAEELTTDGDALMAFDRAGDGSEARRMPILQLRRAAIEPVLEEVLGTPLAEVEQAIDDEFAARSADITGWRIRGQTAIERQTTTARNVLAVLPGEGPHADEVVVLGAHYDHLGMGGTNSAAPGVEAIHHGADDNASGTVALVEVARRLVARGPFPRTVLFVAFSGEERGLLGSAHYAANPAFPLEKTVAMVNLDMVGRLADEKLIVHGTGTGSTMDALVDRLLTGRGFDVTKEPGGFGPSDHASFYAKKIPVLHLFTGSHEDYHRPTDTAEKINYEGMDRIAAFVTDVVGELAATEEPPVYVQVASTQFAGGGGDRPYFGSIPDFGTNDEGYAISGVSKDSPAARGGLKGGDLIIRLGESAVKGLEDFDNALRKHRGGDTVPVVVRRDGQEVSLKVILDPPR